MDIFKTLKATCDIVSKVKHRPILRSLYFNKSKVVATDSYKLVELTCEDFPDINEILLAKDVKNACALENFKTILDNSAKVKGEYPEYEKLLKETPEKKVKLSITHLEKVLKVFKANGHLSVTFAIPEDLTGTVILPGDNEDSKLKIRALIMPLKN